MKKDNYEVVLTNKNYDVIIVGASFAGSALAIELGQAGFQVLLLDHMSFPKPPAQTYPFFNNGIHILKKLGLGSFLEEIKSPVIRHILFQFEDIQIKGKMPTFKGLNRNFGIKRSDLDFALFKKAISYDNVTCVQGFRVAKLVKQGDQVVGVEGVNRLGQTSQFLANMVIGADGRNSIVRRELNLQPIRDIPADYTYYHGSLRGLEPMNPAHFECYRFLDKILAVFPTAKHQHGVYVTLPNSNQKLIDAFKQNPEEAFMEHLKTQFTQIDFQHRVKHAKLLTNIVRLRNYSSHWYEGLGKGWALVGDAVVFKEPCMGQGVYDAMYMGRYLAKLLKKSPDWKQSTNLLSYEYNRHLVEMFKEPFELSVVLTRYQTITTEEKMIHQMISAHPQATAKFLGIFNYANQVHELNSTIEQVAKNRK